MILNSVSDCCDFLADWLELERHYPSTEAPSIKTIPTCITYLNSRFGQLWRDMDHPLQAPLNSSTEPLTLFEYQDSIIDPQIYQVDGQGIVTFAVENQAVWSLGFDPSSPGQLYVSGDWVDGTRSDFGELWRKMDATVEDALVFVLLGNLCLMCSRDEDWDFESEVDGFDEDTEAVLWKHPAWGEWDGFVTDKNQSFVRFSQCNLTVKRRPWPQ